MRQCQHFQDLSKARMKEIDEIRAAGGQTELEKWWKSFEDYTPPKKKYEYEFWKDEDIAYMVKRRPYVKWKVIAEVLGKSISSCNKKYMKVEAVGKLDYYRNFKLESLNGDGYEV